MLWLKRIMPCLAALLLLVAAREARGARPITPVDQHGKDTEKAIPLTSDGQITLELGAELRERFEYYSEPLFGFAEVEEDDYLLHRLLLSADLRVRDRVRVFLQLGNHLEGGKRERRTPTDVDEFDVQQFFIDISAPFDDQTKLTLRAGRQQVTLGAERLVSLRDGPNIRLAFDGARISLTMKDASFDLLALRSVKLKVGAFNDYPNRHEALWGFYGVVPLPLLPDGHSDVYYLGLERDDAPFQQGVADELRHSFGTRIWGNPGAWEYNWEALIQTGSFGDDDILAWTVSSDTAYTFKSLPFKPRIGLKADIISGDRNPNDSRLATFDALFPKQPYFSEAALIAPANLIDVHPSLILQLSEQLSLMADYDLFWKHRIEDAIYTPPGVPLVPAGASGARYIGSQLNVQLGWQMSASVSWTFYYSHFFSAAAVTQAGGRDVDFVGSWIVFKF